MKLPFRMPFNQPPGRDAREAEPAPLSATDNADDAHEPADAASAPQAGVESVSASNIGSDSSEPGGVQEPAGPLASGGPDNRVLFRVAEETWRLERRLDRAASDVGEGPLADVRDALQRLRDVLNEAGVDAVDHDGERYVDGLRLHVLHVEGEAADGVPLRVVRTIRPSILADGQVAVSGQVILGPADQETTNP